MCARHRQLALLFVAGLLLTALWLPGAGQSAARAAGSGPDTAGPVPGGAQTLGVGQRAWYAYQYAGDNSQVIIDMNPGAPGSASFAVWAPQDLEHWAHTGEERPMGRGAANSLFGGDLVWTGQSKTPGTYYIVVDQSGPAPATFTLRVLGSGVTAQPPASTPSPTPAAARLPAAAAPASQAAGPQTAPTAYVFHVVTPTPTPLGRNPAGALPLPSGPQTLGVGETIWYALPNPTANTQTLVQMRANPAGSASFAVWSPENLQTWRAGQKVNPMGAGATSSLYGGNQVWVGNLALPGTYYLVVTQNGPASSTIDLKVQPAGP